MLMQACSQPAKKSPIRPVAPRVLRVGNHALILAMLLFFPQAAKAATASMTLNDVISSVKANEKLYRNIELVYELNYTKNRDISLAPFGPDRIPTMQGKWSSRIVLQQGMFYFKEHGRMDGSNKKTIVDDTLHGFDGQVTRMLERNTGNIHKGKVRSSRIPHPNSLFLERWGVPHPLSKFLSSTENAKRGTKTKWTVVGTETVQKLSCVRLLYQMLVNNEVRVESDVWLCIERNYFPLSIVTRNFGASKTIPIDKVTFSDFRELSSGVWLPFRIKSVSKDGPSLARGKVALGMVYEWSIKKARLNPTYPKSLFRDIKFPNGVLIYEIENGKIVRSSVKGEESIPTEKEPQ